MIFDDPNSSQRNRQDASSEEAGEQSSVGRVRRRRLRATGEHGRHRSASREMNRGGEDWDETAHRRRTSRRSETTGSDRNQFESMRKGMSRPSGKGHYAWLVVLGILIAAVMGFAWYLHKERLVARILPGEAPSSLLLPYIDPVLAPLVTGEAGYSTETMQELGARFRAEQENVNLDEKDIFRHASVITDILKEAIEDRRQHLAKIEKLEAQETSVNAIQKRHLEAAIEVSWQRNSGAYRNRLEELWLRLGNVERGRFQRNAHASRGTLEEPMDGVKDENLDKNNHE